MWTLNNQYFLFVSTTTATFLLGSGINIDNYENNQLINLSNQDYSKIIISNKSLKKLKLQKNSWFKYFRSGMEFQKKILNVQDQGENSLIILQSENNPLPISNISYKIGKSNIWKGIFS